MFVIKRDLRYPRNVVRSTFFSQVLPDGCPEYVSHASSACKYQTKADAQRMMSALDKRAPGVANLSLREVS